MDGEDDDDYDDDIEDGDDVFVGFFYKFRVFTLIYV